MAFKVHQSSIPKVAILDRDDGYFPALGLFLIFPCSRFLLWVVENHYEEIFALVKHCPDPLFAIDFFTSWQFLRYDKPSR